MITPNPTYQQAGELERQVEVLEDIVERWESAANWIWSHRRSLDDNPPVRDAVTYALEDGDLDALDYALSAVRDDRVRTEQE